MRIFNIFELNMRLKSIVNLMKAKRLLLFAFLLAFMFMLTPHVKADDSSMQKTTVKVGVWLVNVGKVDLSVGSYRLDFYLWFKFNPSKISLDEVKEFEFVNVFPRSMRLKWMRSMDIWNTVLEGTS